MLPLKQQPISAEQSRAILNNFVEVPNPDILSNFCVDGRKGPRFDSKNQALNGPYMQMLGGSFHHSALNWILGGGKEKYADVIDTTFGKLVDAGYGISAHTGHHGDHQTKSDCGFDDNFAKIIQTLADGKEGIWKTITDAAPELLTDANKKMWVQLMEKVTEATHHTDNIPSGYEMVEHIAKRKYHANMQNLEGDHKEIAAVVNLKRNTTLDVDKNQDTQAFNLDLWHVIDQAKAIGIDEQQAMLLSLGLYVATEKVLVEDKRGYSIPIIVNK